MFLERKVRHPFLESKGGEPVQNLLQVTVSDHSTPTPTVPHPKSHSFTHEYQKYLVTLLREKVAVSVTGYR